MDFVLVYRCGAAPDSHRVPIFSLHGRAGTNTVPCILGATRFVNPIYWGHCNCADGKVNHLHTDDANSWPHDGRHRNRHGIELTIK